LLATLLLFSACQDRSSKKTPDQTVYEAFRPQFHFTPQTGWMNDPNGLVYYEGEYHLFYQYYPDSTVWGPMHWGHAVSNDMIHWEQLPIALYPDSMGYIFSGSAVVDWNNTSGFGTAQTPPIVAIYTYHDPEGDGAGRIDFQTQGIAYSVDKGRTWTKYENNPVLANPGIRDFRDPKVSWNELSNQWVMTLAVKDHIEFYGSPDLKKWRKLSDFGNTIGVPRFIFAE
jgi:fructan beta-fructosidase